MAVKGSSPGVVSRPLDGRLRERGDSGLDERVVAVDEERRKPDSAAPIMAEAIDDAVESVRHALG